MTSSGSGDRVVIHPDDLRRVATRMQGAAEVLSSTGRHLATRPRPDLPIGLESRVTEVLADANREVQELALELVQEAAELVSRAAEAELGGIDSIAWLMPGLRGALSLPSGQSAVLASSGALLEDRSLRSQRWAEAALDDMTSPIQPSDEVALDLGEFAEVLNDAGGLDEMPPAGVMLDLYVDTGSGGQPEMGTARGVLAAAFDESALGATGIGLIGCLLAGGSGGRTARDP